MCGTELIERDKMLMHLVFTGLILAVMLLTDDYFSLSTWATIAVDILAPVAFYYLFLPMRTVRKT